VDSLLLSEIALTALGQELVRLPSRPRLFVASPQLLAQVAGYAIHQGCLALARRGPEVAPTAIAGAALRGRGLMLALEHLANPVNLGSAFRNAQAFAADGVWLAPGGADPLYRKAVRVSLAATLEVPYARVPDWPAGLNGLKEAGLRLVACVADPTARDIADHAETLSAGVPVALLFGSEEGLSREARELADDRVTIPMAPGFDSLNVATAMGIALHRYASRGTRCAP
jgi:tRNA G18 (ribose-2'-O)-methylase SpoU